MNMLRILSGRKGFHNFTALESLDIAVPATPFMFVEYEDDDIFWKSLSQSLRILNFESGPRMKNGLPKGIRCLMSLQTLQIESGDSVKTIPEWIDCLSSLQYLSIHNCPELKSLPEEMKKLDSLKSLEINFFPELEERCRKPDGVDWPKINTSPTFRLMIQKFTDALNSSLGPCLLDELIYKAFDRKYSLHLSN
ncbi:putative disease resistance protein RGA4 [Amaranthus tricolor]|uniref:putative disease resistance protein RGA4 n=1 Tax=Amaranthus tricolor TaxID=29722 RepID=UPI002586FDD4|nr:putative disease resistance protein RGA4 [Amaranthus tricolor]